MSPTLLALAAILGAALVSMPVFALAYRGRRDPDAARKGSSFLLGIGDFLVHWFMWAIGPLERALLGLGASPDHMNAGGLLFGLASGILIALGRLEAGGAAIALAGVCDILDGRLARAQKVASPYGKFIDSTLDRFVEVFAFLGLVFLFRDREWGPLLAAAAITGSLLVSYTRARGESQGVLCKEGLMQRAERIALLVFAVFFDGPITLSFGWNQGSVVMVVLAIIATGTFATAFHRTLWIGRRLRERDREAPVRK